MTIDARHDRPHLAPADAEWVELWGFDFADLDVSGVAGWVVFVHHPGSARAGYASALRHPDGRLVVVVDPSISLPVLKPSLEFRAEGIWAQHVCETPLSHWSVGLEAFGVALDDVADAAEREPWGERIGVGYDLEWETMGDLATLVAETEATSTEANGVDEARGAFVQSCTVTGELLLDDLEFDLDAPGRRFRAWGSDSYSLLAAIMGPSGGTSDDVAVRVASPFLDVTLVRGLEPNGDWSLALGA